MSQKGQDRQHDARRENDGFLICKPEFVPSHHGDHITTTVTVTELFDFVFPDL